MKPWLIALIVSGLLLFTVNSGLRALVRVGGDPVQGWTLRVAIGRSARNWKVAAPAQRAVQPPTPTRADKPRIFPRTFHERR